MNYCINCNQDFGTESAGYTFCVHCGQEDEAPDLFFKKIRKGFLYNPLLIWIYIIGTLFLVTLLLMSSYGSSVILSISGIAFMLFRIGRRKAIRKLNLASFELNKLEEEEEAERNDENDNIRLKDIGKRKKAQEKIFDKNNSKIRRYNIKIVILCIILLLLMVFNFYLLREESKNRKRYSNQTSPAHSYNHVKEDVAPIPEIVGGLRLLTRKKEPEEVRVYEKIQPAPKEIVINKELIGKGKQTHISIGREGEDFQRGDTIEMYLLNEGAMRVYYNDKSGWKFYNDDQNTKMKEGIVKWIYPVPYNFTSGAEIYIMATKNAKVKIIFKNRS